MRAAAVLITLCYLLMQAAAFTAIAPAAVALTSAAFSSPATTAILHDAAAVTQATAAANLLQNAQLVQLSSDVNSAAASTTLLMSFHSIQAVRDTIGSIFPNPLFLGGTLLLPLLPLIFLAAKGAETGVKTAGKLLQPSITQIPPEAWLRLLFCLVIDAGGDSSIVLPGLLGSLSDFIYAPLEALILSKVFPGAAPVAGLGFLEEILPFTDALPTATIAWVLETLYPASGVTKLLGLNKRGADGARSKQNKKKKESKKGGWFG
jgi:hypothetical protein